MKKSTTGPSGSSRLDNVDNNKDNEANRRIATNGSKLSTTNCVGKRVQAFLGRQSSGKSDHPRTSSNKATISSRPSPQAPKMTNLSKPKDPTSATSLDKLSMQVNLSSTSLNADDTGEKLSPTRLNEDSRSSSPEVNVSDDEETEENQQKNLIHPAVVPSAPQNRLITNLITRVSKRSGSDGIVVAERPRPDKPVRRCESVDDATEAAGLGSSSKSSLASVTDTPKYPQNIKTVASATIVKGPEDATHGIDETVHFVAHYFGNPEPRVTWLKNSSRISPSNSDGRIAIKTYSGESTLIVKALKADDSGKYEVLIENEVGNDAAVASLAVEGPPEPPAGRPFVSDIDANRTSLTLAWYGSTFDGGSIVTGYQVESSSWPISSDSKPPEATDWTVLTEDWNSTSYIVKGLDSSREYIFRVRARNIHGPGRPGHISTPVCFAISSGDENEDSNSKSKSRGNDEEEEEDIENDPTFQAPFEHRQVSLEQGTIFKSKYGIFEELGRGRFGVVFKVKDKETDEDFAAKFIRCRKQEERQKVRDEIEIMNSLEHPKLLQLAAAYENPREIIMVMEYIGGGELFEKVVADDFALTERDCMLFMRQICAAIGYMHEKEIVHLDLKPENILCRSKKSHQIKIIDFGLTRKIKPGEDVRILFGTPEFVSPEVINYEPVTATSDMWSVGVVCYVLLSGLSPFMGDSDVETFANITGIAYDFDDEAFDPISDDAKDFIRRLLLKNQRKRMSAQECLKHKWLAQVDKTSKKSFKELNTDKLKSFLMRRRWQKAAHAIRALGRFTSLGFRSDKDSASSITALSTQSAAF